MQTANPLVPLVRKYVETDAAAVARALERMPDEDLAQALRELPPTVAARAFPYLQAGYAATQLAAGTPELFQAVATELPPERMAQVFARLPNGVRERFVPQLSDRTRAQVQEYLSYPHGSIGQIMTVEHLAFRKELTVRETVAKLRRAPLSEAQHNYVYVVDPENRLVGVVSTYSLLLAPSGQALESLMRTDVFTLDPFLDADVAAREFAKRRFFAAPVVDAQGQLLGVVKAARLIAGAKNEAATDLQRMFGVGAEERSFSPIGFSLRKRLPWLHVNLATAFAAAAVVSVFEGTIAQITALAIFLPVVAGQGGNAGAQSLAIVMRGLIMREIPRDRVRRVILKEGTLGLISGAVTGLVTAVAAWLWMGNPWLGVVIGLGMVVNLLFAGLAGAAIPIAMKKLGLDPAQSSSIMLTTVTDIVGFSAFLGFAVLFRDLLI